MIFDVVEFAHARQTRSETPVCARLIANLAENLVNLSVSAKNNRIEYKVGAEMHRPFVVFIGHRHVKMLIVKSAVERNVSLPFGRACSRSTMLKRVWHCARSIAAFDKNAEKWAYVLQADLYNKLSSAKELTLGPPPSRLGNAQASLALLSLLTWFTKLSP